MKLKLELDLTVYKEKADEFEIPTYIIESSGISIYIGGEFIKFIHRNVSNPLPNLFIITCYDLENIIKQVVDCDGIELASDQYQFWAYTDSYERAMKFKIELDTFFEEEFETEDYLPKQD
jgi:hypothetical protein